MSDRENLNHLNHLNQLVNKGNLAVSATNLRTEFTTEKGKQYYLTLFLVDSDLIQKRPTISEKPNPEDVKSLVFTGYTYINAQYGNKVHVLYRSFSVNRAAAENQDLAQNTSMFYRALLHVAQNYSIHGRLNGYNDTTIFIYTPVEEHDPRTTSLTFPSRKFRNLVYIDDSLSRVTVYILRDVVMTLERVSILAPTSLDSTAIPSESLLTAVLSHNLKDLTFVYQRFIIEVDEKWKTIEFKRDSDTEPATNNNNNNNKGKEGRPRIEIFTDPSLAAIEADIDGFEHGSTAFGLMSLIDLLCRHPVTLPAKAAKIDSQNFRTAVLDNAFDLAIAVATDRHPKFEWSHDAPMTGNPRLPFDASLKELKQADASQSLLPFGWTLKTPPDRWDARFGLRHRMFYLRYVDRTTELNDRIQLRPALGAEDYATLAPNQSFHGEIESRFKAGLETTTIPFYYRFPNEFKDFRGGDRIRRTLEEGGYEKLVEEVEGGEESQWKEAINYKWNRPTRTLEKWTS
jgi:hypothetical protein